MPRHSDAQELGQILSTSVGRYGPSRTQMGVVSPCSSCKNRRVTPDGSKPPCPRRHWIALGRDARDQGTTEPGAYLTATGTSDEDTLANPVHSKETGSVWVWVATLDDNQGVIDPDSDSGLATGSVLDPGFDTDYIRCRLVPYVPEESRYTYSMAGAFKEGDRLKITSLQNYQSPAAGERVSIGGFAKKVDFHLGYTYETPQRNTIASGF